MGATPNDGADRGHSVPRQERRWDLWVDLTRGPLVVCLAMIVAGVGLAFAVQPVFGVLAAYAAFVVLQGTWNDSRWGKRFAELGPDETLLSAFLEDRHKRRSR